MDELTKILQEYKSALKIYSIDIARQKIIDLVPKQMLRHDTGGAYDNYCDGWNECCKEIVRRMEVK